MTPRSNPDRFHRIPCFQVLDKDGKPPEHLGKYFLGRCIIDIANVPDIIKDNEGVAYQAIYDEFIYSEPNPHNNYIQAIGSFQKWPEGNFVVLRADRKGNKK